MDSEFFPVSRGTRQGCPLSLGLFALLIEPLAIALCVSTGVKGIQVSVLEEKTALYADKMVLFLGDNDQSLTSALSILYTPSPGFLVLK